MALRIIFWFSVVSTAYAVGAPPSVPAFSREEIRAKLDQLYVGTSPSAQQLKDRLTRVILVEGTVLIVGETGTGKEVVANAIHTLGTRRKQEFVAKNTGAMPENLVESELFGHKKGAFTGATVNHPGAFATANKGTLFLDELGTMPLPLQVKFLRALEEKAVTPVGGSEPVPVDVRIIAATNDDPVSAVRAGTLRRDLYFRLNVLTLTLPPLRERREDMPALIAHFLRSHQRNLEFSPDALQLLNAYPWPGNVRELANIIEFLVHFVDGDSVQASDLPAHIQDPKPFLDRMGWSLDHPSLDSRTESAAVALRRIGCESIIALHSTAGSVSKVARFYGVPEQLVEDVLRNLPKRHP